MNCLQTVHFGDDVTKLDHVLSIATKAKGRELSGSDSKKCSVSRVSFELTLVFTTITTSTIPNHALQPGPETESVYGSENTDSTCLLLV